MKIEEIQQNAFGMPFVLRAHLKIEYKMTNREYFIIKYETDYDALQSCCPRTAQSS